MDNICRKKKTPGILKAVSRMPNIQITALIVTSSPESYPTVIRAIVSPNLHMGKQRMKNLSNRPKVRQLVKSTVQVCPTQQQTSIHYISAPLICQMAVIIPVSWWCCDG